MPISAMTQGAPFLLFRCSAVRAALPLTDVRETLRPLSVAAIEAAPAFVLGMAVIRGLPTAVIDAGLLLDRTRDSAFAAAGGSRFITLRVTERPVALAVDAVLGIRHLAESALATLPPLLGASEQGPIEQLARLDGDVWMVLRAGRLIPDTAVSALDYAAMSA